MSDADDQDKDDSPSKTSPARESELDLLSPDFNALKALRAPSVPDSAKNARTYDNLAQFEPIFRREFCRHPNTEPPQHKNAASKAKSLPLLENPVIQRRFTAEQQPIASKPRNNRRTRNIISRMSDPSKLHGPIQLLQRWREQRTQVKIITRNEKSVDGHVFGIIEAFDKHWNVIVSNAEQVIKRRNFKYCFTPLVASDEQDEDATTKECMQRLASLNIQIPEMKAVGKHGRSVECKRNVPQLLVRGEHIVTIITISEQTKEVLPQKSEQGQQNEAKKE